MCLVCFCPNPRPLRVPTRWPSLWPLPFWWLWRGSPSFSSASATWVGVCTSRDASLWTSCKVAPTYYTCADVQNLMCPLFFYRDLCTCNAWLLRIPVKKASILESLTTVWIILSCTYYSSLYVQILIGPILQVWIPWIPIPILDKRILGKRVTYILILGIYRYLTISQYFSH